MGDFIRKDCDELVSVTKQLYEVVEEVTKQIVRLKEERADTTGETKEAYSLIIGNKIWILQKLISVYFAKTQSLELDGAKPLSEVLDEDEKVDVACQTE